MIPSLNLRGVRREQTTPTPRTAGSNASASHASATDMSSSSPVTSPMGTSTNDAAEFLGCDVHSISDVNVLRAKLVEAQRIFVALEHNYDRALDAKQRQMEAVVAAMHRDGAASGGGMPAWSPRKARQADRGVQVGPSMPSSLSSTPRSMQDQHSARLRAALSRSTVTPRGAAYNSSIYGTSTMPTRPSTTTPRGAARSTWSPASYRSPRNTSASGTAYREPPSSPSITPTGPATGVPPFRPYQPATRRRQTTTTAQRATTPRY